MFEIDSENYDEVKVSLEELLGLIKGIQTVEIDGVSHKIIFYLCTDYKMARLLYGHKASNATNSCVWCHAALNVAPTPTDLYNINRSLQDPIYLHQPLIDFIDYKMCIIDMLHLLLRISDKLFSLLILKLIRLDQNDGANINNRPHFLVFMNFLKNQCKISNPYYSNKSEDVLKLRSLNKNERLKIFEKIFEFTRNLTRRKSFFDIFPDDNQETFKYENYIWYQFLTIYNNLKENKIENSNLRGFLKAYLVLNEQENNATTIFPYLHSLVFHGEEMMFLHGNISIFTTESNEKFNDFCSIYYHSSTNKNNTNKKYLKQLFKKRNRIEFFDLKGSLREFLFDTSSSEDEEDEEDDVV
jgi:hypothetical protein